MGGGGGLRSTNGGGSEAYQFLELMGVAHGQWLGAAGGDVVDHRQDVAAAERQPQCTELIERHALRQGVSPRQCPPQTTAMSTPNSTALGA